MTEDLKRVYTVYKRFQVFGGALNCKLFTEAFPRLTEDDSFEYNEMKEAYKPEEFANSYLRQELIAFDLANPYNRKEYEKLRLYLKSVLQY